eukprot:Skav216487  [mRNA]  locus=scaffold1123:470018:472462:- [translate_table: standard]
MVGTAAGLSQELVDPDCTGEAMAESFDNAVYRLQVDTWPELDEQGAAVALNGWVLLLPGYAKACDEDGSGSMTYDEMLAVFRKSEPSKACPPYASTSWYPMPKPEISRDATRWLRGFPGLSIASQKLPEQVQALLQGGRSCFDSTAGLCAWEP